MRRLRTLPVGSRALMVAAILYGVLLQAFLAAATPVVAAEAGILCSHESRGPGPDQGTPRHDHRCCLAAHPGSFAPPPTPASVPLAARAPILVLAEWPPASRPHARLPTHAVSARGPPLA